MFFSIVQAFPGTVGWPDDLHGIEATANLICHLVDFAMCPCDTKTMAWQKKQNVVWANYQPTLILYLSMLFWIYQIINMYLVILL